MSDTGFPCSQVGVTGMGANCLRVVLSLSALAVVGCQPTERVVRVSTFFDGLPNVQGGLKPDEDPSAARPEVVEPPLIFENPDGTKTLRSTTIRHVMVHLMRELDNEDDTLLYEQVISEETKRQLKARGDDPKSAVAFLKQNQRDISKLFGRMPGAENSPGVIMTSQGPRVMKLELTGTAARGMVFTELWVVLENNQWKLLWVR